MPERPTAVPLPEDQPLLDLWPDVANALRLSRTAAYTMARKDAFPIEVIRHGARLKCRTADVRRYLGLDLTESASA
jgi:hypothetical protein